MASTASVRCKAKLYCPWFSGKSSMTLFTSLAVVNIYAVPLMPFLCLEHQEQTDDFKRYLPRCPRQLVS